jgi:hypothetical protein
MVRWGGERGRGGITRDSGSTKVLKLKVKLRKLKYKEQSCQKND